MSRSYRVPSAENFGDLSDFANAIARGQAEAPGFTTTTQSLTGEPRVTVTSYTVSDVLQGTLDRRDPQETNLLVNQALTSQLSFIDSAGFGGFATTSGQGPATLNFPGASNGGGGSGGSSGGGGGYTGDYSGAIDSTTGSVKEEWVAQLPTTHPNGALIWHNRGKASREMHLPTNEVLSVDIAQHKQDKTMPAEWQHPWNMDRQGGTIGGEAGYWTNVDDSHGTIMKGDDSSAAGQSGAFGFLSPEEEQYYISMAWPYSGDVAERFIQAERPDIAEKCKTLKKDMYKGKRVLVYSVRTKKGCVCTPGDWGPHPYYSNGATERESINGSYFGLVADVHHALGTNHGDEFMVGWLPDDTPLGPFNPPAAGQGLSNNGGGPSQTVGANGSLLQDSDDDMAYAGQRIVDHPNFRMDGSDGGYDVRKVFLEGYTVDQRAVSFTPAKKASNPAQGWLMPSLLNWLWYILEGGFVLGYSGGVYGYKPKGNKPGNPPSNHGKGGAIDIGAIGIVSQGAKMWSTWNMTEARQGCPPLFDFISTLPQNCRPQEIGGPYATEDPIHVYYDEGHIHFGFNENQCGKLIPALKRRQGPSTALIGNRNA